MTQADLPRSSFFIMERVHASRAAGRRAATVPSSHPETILMPHSRSYRFLGALVQSVAGIVALALLTLVCHRLRLNLATAVCLYLMVVVLLSVQGNFLSSGVVSLIAVGCLMYYFAPPIFSFRVKDQFEVVAIIVFLTTSALITHFVSRVRKSAEELRQSQANLAHVSRVTTMGELTASLAHEINQPIAAAGYRCQHLFALACARAT